MVVFLDEWLFEVQIYKEDEQVNYQILRTLNTTCNQK